MIRSHPTSDNRDGVLENSELCFTCSGIITDVLFEVLIWFFDSIAGSNRSSTYVDHLREVYIQTSILGGKLVLYMFKLLPLVFKDITLKNPSSIFTLREKAASK